MAWHNIPPRYRLRVAAIIVLSVTAITLLTGIVTVSTSAVTFLFLLLAAVLAELMHDISPDTPEPLPDDYEEPEIRAGLDDDLTTLRFGDD
jgi:hypothetical protein